VVNLNMRRIRCAAMTRSSIPEDIQCDVVEAVWKTLR
jgi:hypothetical protein